MVDLCRRLLTSDALTARQQASALNFQARSLFELGRFDEAAQIRAREIEKLETAAADAVYIATVRVGLAWALFRDARFAESLRVAGQAYLERDTHLGPSALGTLSALHLCIYNLDRLRRYAEMLPLAQELYGRRLEASGTDTDETKDARDWLRRAEDQLQPRRGVARTAQAVTVTPSSSGAAASKPRKPSAVSGLVVEIVEGVSRGVARGVIEGMLS
ncbi:hypothetical protein [Microbacterium sp. ZW T5_56]|uniref:hypothetical protein n=1 Tax=Microbacterium sp. ZW T5_56 TaxID=3378081 RepID=UPI003854D541